MYFVLPLALAFRVLLFLAVPRAIDSPDAVHYLADAEHMANGDFLALNPAIPPLYPAAIAAANLLVPNLELAGQLVSLIASTVLLIPVYLLSRHMHGPRTACFTIVLLALWPWPADYATRLSTEAIASLFWFSAVYFTVSAILSLSNSTLFQRNTFAAVLAFFLLHLTRPEGTFIWFGGLLILAVAARHTPKRLLPFALLSAALLTLHALVLYRLTGHITINPRVAPVLNNQPEGVTVLEDFLHTFNALLGDVPAVMLGPVLWMLAGVGLVGIASAPRNTRAEAIALAFALLQWLVVIPNLSPAPRYIMTSLIVALCFAARGLDVLAQSPSLRQFRYAPLALVLTLFAWHTALTIAREHLPGRPPTQPLEFKVAGQWMREHLETGLIMTRKPQVGYYAGMPTAGPRLDASLQDILSLADAGDFRYLVIDERYSAAMVPSLAPLLDPANAPPPLRLLNSNASPYPNARVLIYAFR